jgi:glycosyltransferase involved in cell wall biosynthesis
MTGPLSVTDAAMDIPPPIRVLSVISTVSPESGGPIHGLLSQQAQLKSRVQFNIVSLDPPDAEFLKAFPVPVTATGVATGKADRRNPFSRHYNYSPHLVPWLKQNVRNYDVILVHGLWNYATYAASRVLPGSGMPYFVFTHGMMDPWFREAYPLKHMAKQAFWLFNEGPLLVGARSVLFTAEDEKVLARGVFAGHRAYTETVVGYGTNEPPAASPADADAFKAACPGVGDRPYLLFLSRIHPKKGCDLLIEAFASVAARDPDLQLVIAGPDQTGWLAKLKAQAQALGIAERVHFPGGLFKNAKWGAIRGAEAFVLPSHQENFGIVVAEAMACSVPVLTTRKVNIWREVEASGGGMAETDTRAGIERLLTRWLDLGGAEKAAMRIAARGGYDTHFRMEVASAGLYAVLSSHVARLNEAA